MFRQRGQAVPELRIGRDGQPGLGGRVHEDEGEQQ